MKYSAGTDVGRKRPHNEDHYVSRPELGIHIVCDGMGGHAAGEIASSIAAEQLEAALTADIEMLRSLSRGDLADRRQALQHMRDAVRAANAAVRAAADADESRRGMGTTLTAALHVDDRILVGHVGDSRMYLVRGGGVHQITTDHTILTEMLRAGRVASDDAEKAAHLNALTRAIGVYPDVEVDVLEVDVLPGDVFLLCSDGLHAFFDDFDLPTFFAHVKPERAVEDLIAFANKRGGHDNITAIALFGERKEETAESLQVRLTLDVLQGIPMFHYLSYAELLKVIPVCRPTSVPADKAVIEEGTPGEDFWMITNGECRVHRRGAEIARLGRGRYFGEMSLIDNRPRSATVTSAERTELVQIRREDFYELLRDDPVLAVKLLWNIIQTLSAAVRAGNEELIGRAPTAQPHSAHPYTATPKDP